jgi:hypothetical protein
LPDDATPATDAHVVSELRHCMATGQHVVVYNGSRITGYLYDLLNQNYDVHSLPAAGPGLAARTVRKAAVVIAGETHFCEVHPEFRITFVFRTGEAEKLSAPFLSRHEKYVLDLEDRLVPDAVKRFAFEYIGADGIAAFHPEVTLPRWWWPAISIPAVSGIHATKGIRELNYALLRVCRPEDVLAAPLEHREEYIRQYMEVQEHFSLTRIVQRRVRDAMDGRCLWVLTHDLRGVRDLISAAQQLQQPRNITANTVHYFHYVIVQCDLMRHARDLSTELVRAVTRLRADASAVLLAVIQTRATSIQFVNFVRAAVRAAVQSSGNDQNHNQDASTCGCAARAMVLCALEHGTSGAPADLHDTDYDVVFLDAVAATPAERGALQMTKAVGADANVDDEMASAPHLAELIAAEAGAPTTADRWRRLSEVRQYRRLAAATHRKLVRDYAAVHASVFAGRIPTDNETQLLRPGAPTLRHAYRSAVTAAAYRCRGGDALTFVQFTERLVAALHRVAVVETLRALADCDAPVLPTHASIDPVLRYTVQGLVRLRLTTGALPPQRLPAGPRLALEIAHVRVARSAAGGSTRTPSQDEPWSKSVFDVSDLCDRAAVPAGEVSAWNDLRKLSGGTWNLERASSVGDAAFVRFLKDVLTSDAIQQKLPTAYHCNGEKGEEVAALESLRFAVTLLMTSSRTHLTNVARAAVVSSMQAMIAECARPEFEFQAPVWLAQVGWRDAVQRLAGADDGNALAVACRAQAVASFLRFPLPGRDATAAAAVARKVTPMSALDWLLRAVPRSNDALRALGWWIAGSAPSLLTCDEPSLLCDLLSHTELLDALGSEIMVALLQASVARSADRAAALASVSLYVGLSAPGDELLEEAIYQCAVRDCGGAPRPHLANALANAPHRVAEAALRRAVVAVLSRAAPSLVRDCEALVRPVLVNPTWARAFVAAARGNGNTALLAAFDAGGELNDLPFATAIAEAFLHAATSSVVVPPTRSLCEPTALLTPRLARIVHTYVAASFMRVLTDADSELRAVLTTCTMAAPARVGRKLCAQWNAMRDAVAAIADPSGPPTPPELGEPLNPSKPPTAVWFFSATQDGGVSPLQAAWRWIADTVQCTLAHLRQDADLASFLASADILPAQQRPECALFFAQQEVPLVLRMTRNALPSGVLDRALGSFVVQGYASPLAALDLSPPSGWDEPVTFADTRERRWGDALTQLPDFGTPAPSPHSAGALETPLDKRLSAFLREAPDAAAGLVVALEEFLDSVAFGTAHPAASDPLFGPGASLWLPASTTVASSHRWRSCRAELRVCDALDAWRTARSVQQLLQSDGALINAAVENATLLFMRRRVWASRFAAPLPLEAFGRFKAAIAALRADARYTTATLVRVMRQICDGIREVKLHLDTLPTSLLCPALIAMLDPPATDVAPAPVLAVTTPQESTTTIGATATPSDSHHDTIRPLTREVLQRLCRNPDGVAATWQFLHRVHAYAWFDVAATQMARVRPPLPIRQYREEDQTDGGIAFLRATESTTAASVTMARAAFGTNRSAASVLHTDPALSLVVPSGALVPKSAAAAARAVATDAPAAVAASDLAAVPATAGSHGNRAVPMANSGAQPADANTGWNEQLDPAASPQSGSGAMASPVSTARLDSMRLGTDTSGGSFVRVHDTATDGIMSPTAALHGESGIFPSGNVDAPEQGMGLRMGSNYST